LLEGASLAENVLDSFLVVNGADLANVLVLKQTKKKRRTEVSREE